MASYDKDLNPVLERATDAELMPLVEVMLKKLSNAIDTDERYKENPKKPTKYVDLIADEIRLFGGNSFANMFRGGEGVSYHEVVCDVAKKLKVDFNSSSSVQRIEQAINLKIAEDAFQKMSDEEKEELIKEVSPGFRYNPALGPITLQMLIKAGGFKSYQLAVIVANSVAKTFFGVGLSFAANHTLTKVISIFAGPIGWVISGIWAAIDIAGPTYKTTIPCVIYVAALREKYFR